MISKVSVVKYELPITVNYYSLSQFRVNKE